MQNTDLKTHSEAITKGESMSEEELASAIESYVESYLLVEYGIQGVEAARDAYEDMGLEKEGITFTGFVLQTEDYLAEAVVEEFIGRAY